MKLKDAIARIEELEKRVRDLEARPVYIPLPYHPIMPERSAPIPSLPYYPTPLWWQPPTAPLPYTITCQADSTG